MKIAQNSAGAPPCKRCGRKLHVREHSVLPATNYYRRWYECMNPNCRTKQVMPREFFVSHASTFDAGERPPEQSPEEYKRTMDECRAYQGSAPWDD